MNNIDIPGYNIEHTPTKSDKSGALLYIPKELNYKNRNDLKLYKGKNLESVFIEVLSKFGKSTIIGYNQIWQYKSFFSYENKNVTLLGDINIDLSHHELPIQRRKLLEKIHFGSFVTTD